MPSKKTSAQVPLNVWRRQNVLGILVDSLHLVWVVALNLLRDVGDLFKRPLLNIGLGLGIWAVLIIVFVLPRFLATKYQLTESEFILRRGIFRRQKLHINYNNIQTVQRNQWFFMVPFGVESLTVETAAHSGNEPEVKLVAVPFAVGDELERRQHKQSAIAVTPEQSTTAQTFAEKLQAKPQDASTPKTSYHHTLDLPELIAYALTSLGFIPTIIALLGGFQYLQQAPSVAKWADAQVPAITNWAVGKINQLDVVGIGLMVLSLMAVSIISSVGVQLVRYWNFTVDFDGDRITTKKGLLQIGTVSASASRIQAVRFKANVIRGLLHKGTAQVVLASAVGKEDDDDDMVLYPMLARNQVWARLHNVVAWLPSQQPTMQTFATGRFAMIRNAIIVPLIITGVCVYYFHTWGLLALLLVALGIAYGEFAVANRGFAISDQILFISSGSTLERTDFAVSRQHIQSVEVKQSLWMVRHDWVHVVVHIRKGNSDEEIELRYVPAQIGDQVYAWYLGPAALAGQGHN